MPVRPLRSKVKNKKRSGHPVRCPDCGRTLFFVEGEALGTLQINFLCRSCEEEKKINLRYLKKSLQSCDLRV